MTDTALPTNPIVKTHDGVPIAVNQTGRFEAFVGCTCPATHTLYQRDGRKCPGKMISRTTLKAVMSEIDQRAAPGAPTPAISLSLYGHTYSEVRVIGVEKSRNSWGPPRYRSDGGTLFPEGTDIRVCDEQRLADYRSVCAEIVALEERLRDITDVAQWRRLERSDVQPAPVKTDE